MAAGAALVGEDRDRAAIVVAAQALGLGVGAVQRHAGLALVIEGKVRAQRLPALAFVAQAAFGGEGVVGQHGAAAGPPAVAFGVRPALDGAGGDQEGGGEAEGRVEAFASDQKLLWA